MADKRVALVIGASSGIGEAAARMLVKRGHTVYAANRDASQIKIDGAEALQLDVFDADAIDRAVATIIDARGRIDALVYSAGFYVAGAVEETPMKDVEDQLYVYFTGAVRCVRAVTPHMRAQQFGRIVLMSSSAAAVSIPFHAAYSASKGALSRWTEAFAYEVAPFGVHASYIEAGAIKTNAPNAMREPAEPLDVYEERRRAAITAFKEALGKGLNPSKIARAIAHAIESENPRVRYRVGRDGNLFPLLQALLGERRFRSVMAKSFKV